MSQLLDHSYTYSTLIPTGTIQTYTNKLWIRLMLPTGILPVGCFSSDLTAYILKMFGKPLIIMVEYRLRRIISKVKVRTEITFLNFKTDMHQLGF